jgi:putative spermidine/putrescine transport system substrate-binding protein
MRKRRVLPPARSLGAVLGTVVLASAGLSACSSGGGSSTVVLGSFAGNEQTGFMACAINGFTKQTNIKVLYQAGNGAQNLAIVRAQKSDPSIDVIVGNDGNEVSGASEGLLQAYDKSQIPNLADVAPQYKKSDPYTIPLAISVGGIEYNTKVFQEHGWPAPTSISDLWNPLYKGHVGLIDLSSSYSQEFLVQVAIMNGGSPSDLTPAFARLEQLKPSLQGVYQSDAQLDQAFAQGSVWIAPRGGERVELQKNDGLPVAFVQPSDGTQTLAIDMFLVKNAKHQSAAYQLINYMLSPQVQKCLAADTGYGPVRSDVPVSSTLRSYLIPQPGVTETPVNWTALDNQLSSLTLQFDQDMSK